ncbi:SGNH/GDSL hydrolase family protein [Lacticaseibacillus yichunensis]|uniref:SGNH/GDSL hydrolase family protein n=1 Tax=Lacticaseibacillus yichunensis TaxID=2486015 RepID=A0ABW4CPW6_9LACO|nr:GDSL-type esterase/lipase family protein [Lacticaseibacillus yichunensis]
MNLTGKILYSFGDSLIAGHELNYGLLDDLAARHQLAWQNFAQNGATVVPTKPTDHTWPSDNQVPDIAAQVQGAPSEQPDLIIFDGLVNDCMSYIGQLRAIGTPALGYADADFDRNTFAGAFEHACWTMRQKYPAVPILYVSVHHMPNIPQPLQDQAHALAALLCAKWAFPVVDVYRAGTINTCLPAMAAEFSYNGRPVFHGGDGTHLNKLGYQRYYTPMLEAALAAV